MLRFKDLLIELAGAKDKNGPPKLVAADRASPCPLLTEGTCVRLGGEVRGRV